MTKQNINAEQLEQRRELAALHALTAQVEADEIAPGSEADPADVLITVNADLKQRGLPPFGTVDELKRAVEWWLDNLMVDARMAREDHGALIRRAATN
jgi:hypothetical protein